MYMHTGHSTVYICAEQWNNHSPGSYHSCTDGVHPVTRNPVQCQYKRCLISWSGTSKQIHQTGLTRREWLCTSIVIHTGIYSVNHWLSVLLYTGNTHMLHYALNNNYCETVPCMTVSSSMYHLLMYTQNIPHTAAMPDTPNHCHEIMHH